MKRDMDFGDIILKAAHNVAEEDYETLEEAQVAILQEMNRISNEDEETDDSFSFGIMPPLSPIPERDTGSISRDFQMPNLADIFDESFFGDRDPRDVDKFVKLFGEGCESVGIKPKHGSYVASGGNLRKVNEYVQKHWDDED